MFKKISLAIALFGIAGVASASANSGGNNCLLHIGDLQLFCQPVQQPGPVRAPEIDPASAMAGLTMLAAGLAVLRGRRKKVSQE